MKQFKKYLMLPLCLLGLSACSSGPQVAEFSNTSDPGIEMARVEANIHQAQEEQMNVLSPRNFDLATESLEKAKEARANNKDQHKVLHLIALSQTYLEQTKTVSKVSGQVIPGVITQRQFAITAEAPKYFSKEFLEADTDLKDITRDIENNNTASAEKYRLGLEQRYSDIELLAIQKTKLGEAKDTLAQASSEGAKKLVPQALASSEKQMALDDAAIVRDRHNVAVVDNASADAKKSTARLLSLVRQAKSSSQQNPEQLATQLESNKNAADQAQVDLAQSNAEINSKNGSIAVLSAENDKLESKGQLEKRFESARQKFTKDEAEVYKQGDKLLLRLKGLSFSKDQSVITSNNYPLLAKVQKVIKENEAGTILVEGHTDSTGSKVANEKLSTARAEAVQDYLKANNFISDEKISAKGFAESKPIASNKTALGRAQNRRVDVIIKSEQVR